MIRVVFPFSSHLTILDSNLRVIIVPIKQIRAMSSQSSSQEPSLTLPRVGGKSYVVTPSSGDVDFGGLPRNLRRSIVNIIVLDALYEEVKIMTTPYVLPVHASKTTMEWR